MSYPEVEVLAGQTAELLDVLSDLTADDWARPTRLPGWTVKDLAMHVGAGAAVMADIARTDAGGREPNCDRVTWWRMPDRTPADTIKAMAVDVAEKVDDRDVGARVAEGLDAFVSVLRSYEADRVIGNEWRTLRADEFAASRVLEYGVHTMDLGHALLKGERITPSAAAIVANILSTLYGEPLPAGLGWDQRTFILTGLGRRALSANERFTLGADAGRFPIVA